MPFPEWLPAGTGRLLLRSAVAVIACAIVSTPARAECAGSDAIDACLVGIWRPSDEGQTEWLRRHMPTGIAFSRSGKTATITYNADGTYSAVSAVRQTALVETGDTRSRGDGVMTTTSTGGWSVAGGHLNICGTDHIAGRMKVTTAGGSQHTIPLPRPASTGSANFAYSCTDAALETRKSFPGIADPMVIRYTRIGTGEVPPE